MDYKEKIKEAKRLYETANADQKYVLESLFPEIRESDDEKIRKGLIKLVKATQSDELWCEYCVPKVDALAWLEKQGEQKSIWHNEDEEPKRGSLILLIMQSGNPIVAKIIEPNHTFNHGERWAYIDDLLEKQSEQKTAWSEDETSIAIKNPDAYKIGFADGEAHAKEEMQSSWSEEDKNFMYDTLSNLTELKDRYGEGYGNVGKCIDWLKSLKARYTWKPSDEQIRPLEYAIDYFKKKNNDTVYLESLYNDLKKLREDKL